MGRITANQSQQIMGILQTNVDWDNIDFEGIDAQDSIIRSPKEIGKQFMLFLQTCGRMNSARFPVWNIVEVGQADVPREIIEDLSKSNQCSVSESVLEVANHFLDNIPFVCDLREKELVYVAKTEVEEFRTVTMPFRGKISTRDIVSQIEDISGNSCVCRFDVAVRGIFDGTFNKIKEPINILIDPIMDYGYNVFHIERKWNVYSLDIRRVDEWDSQEEIIFSLATSPIPE